MSRSLATTVELLERGVADRLHLGGQLYVSLGGVAVADLAFGEARPGRPMAPDDLMLWLSSSKPVAAVAIAQLWERGRLGLDDRVSEHLPAFGQQGKERISVRHLLTHTGGIRMVEVGWPALAWNEIIAKICGRKPEPGWVPGQKAGYHLASSWFILGELVRRIDGRPFERYVREEIFLPIGAEDAWIGMPANRFRAYGERIVPMFKTEGGRVELAGTESEARVTRCSPGGNGYGPMRDLGRFYEALLGAAEAEDGLLRPPTAEALAARHRVGMVDRTFKHRLDWGLGVILNSEHYGAETAPYGYGPHASARAYGHSGYRSSLGLADPEHGLVVALAVNGMPEDDRHHRRFRALATAIYEDLGLV